MTDNINASSGDKAQFYAERLAKMIRCKTVSEKNDFKPEEFLKLRKVIAELFPLVTQKAEFTVFGDDAYLYKLKGKDETRNVMVMSHHDVVEATGDWQEEPFGGVIKDGKLWGRGTVDTKTPLFAEFSAIEELLFEGFEFPVNVYLFSSHNEETGGDGAVLALDYFNKNHITFDWISDEGGAVIDPPMAGISKKCAMMAVHEKGRCIAELTAKKSKGHVGLAGNHQTPVMRMVSFIAEANEKKPFIRKLYTEEDGSCKGEAFLRCINDEDLAKDLDALKEIAAKYEVEIVVRDSDNEYYKPTSLESDGYKYVRKIVQSVFDYAVAVPFILPAGTDARRFTGLSDSVIRFAPIDIDGQQYASVHSENENINVDKIPLAVKFYKELLKNYK